MHFTVQTLKFCDKTEKVNQGLQSQTPPYLPNGDTLWWVFYIIGFKTLENGGVGHLQIPKTKSQLGRNAHVTQKPQIFNIFQTLYFQATITSPIALKHLKMGGYVTSKLSTHIIINPLHPHLSGPPEISYPPYLANGDRLWWDFFTIGFRTLENGGVGHFKTQKKKPNFGGDTHVTLNPKP